MRFKAAWAAGGSRSPGYDDPLYFHGLCQTGVWKPAADCKEVVNEELHIGGHRDRQQARLLALSRKTSDLARWATGSIALCLRQHKTNPLATRRLQLEQNLNSQLVSGMVHVQSGSSTLTARRIVSYLSQVYQSNSNLFFDGQANSIFIFVWSLILPTRSLPKAKTPQLLKYILSAVFQSNSLSKSAPLSSIKISKVKIWGELFKPTLFCTPALGTFVSKYFWTGKIVGRGLSFMTFNRPVRHPACVPSTWKPPLKQIYPFYSFPFTPPAFSWVLFLGKHLLSKTDEFSEKFRKGGGRGSNRRFFVQIIWVISESNLICLSQIWVKKT